VKPLTVHCGIIKRNLMSLKYVSKHGYPMRFEPMPTPTNDVQYSGIKEATILLCRTLNHSIIIILKFCLFMRNVNSKICR